MSHYYENIEKKNYKEWCDYQDEYFKFHPLIDYVYFDISFVNRVNGKYPHELLPHDKYLLDFLGAFDDENKIIHLSLNQCREYVAYYNQSVQQAFKLVKQKRMNDYVMRHSSEFSNIINYFDESQK